MRWTYNDILIARYRLSGVAVRTPLLQLHESSSIWIKPEVLQPIGSFKIRGAYNAIAARIQTGPLDEVTTLSAGNMSQAVAWSARRLGLRSTAIMPADAPEMKKSATRGYGASIETIARSEIMTAMQDGRFNDRPGFIHPFNDPLVAAGNGTIGLEILEDLPDVDTVIVPVGGGGLVLGIASAIKETHPNAQIFGVQPVGGSALAVSLAAGEPRSTPYETFVDGAGAPFVAADAFPDFQRLLAGCLTVTDDQTKSALARLATRNKLLTEGAGALAVAAALALPEEQRGKTVCILSGGSIDPNLAADILRAYA